MSRRLDRARRTRRTHRAERVLLVAALAAVAPTASCYTYGAVRTGQLSPGTRAAFALSDRGRASLGEQIGPRVLQVEGTLVQDTGDAYLVNVSAVRSIDGGTARWGGERIALGHSDVESIRRRDFSKGKTAAAVGAVAATVVVFALTRNLSIFGIGRAPPRDPSDPPDQ
jgi:hypothetical protein